MSSDFLRNFSKQFVLGVDIFLLKLYNVFDKLK